jgi:hypothetical protein
MAEEKSWTQRVAEARADGALAPFFERNDVSWKEPQALFESIGNELAGDNLEKRRQAFWVLVALTPELTDLLHERESRLPGWRSESRPLQRRVNRAMDVVTKLHRSLVVERRFVAITEHTDPRPFVRTTVRNWQTDDRRRRSREVSLDDPLADKPALDQFVADAEQMSNFLQDEGHRELRSWGWIAPEEMDLFEALYVDEEDFSHLRVQLRIKDDAVLYKRLSRARQRAVARRDAIVLRYLLEMYFDEERARAALEKAGWAGRLRHVIEPKAWEVSAANKEISRCFMTRRFNGTRGHVWLMRSPLMTVQDPTADELAIWIPEDCVAMNKEISLMDQNLAGTFRFIRHLPKKTDFFESLGILTNLDVTTEDLWLASDVPVDNSTDLYSSGFHRHAGFIRERAKGERPLYDEPTYSSE